MLGTSTHQVFVNKVTWPVEGSKHIEKLTTDFLFILFSSKMSVSSGKL